MSSLQTAPLTAQCHIDSPLGRVLLARTAKGLAGLWFTEGQKHLPGELRAAFCPEDALFEQVRVQLGRYWQAPAGQPVDFNVSLDLIGTPFQQSVWQVLLTLRHGQTGTYGDIAAHVGNPQGGRAVGAAVGRNPISIIVPCHRVVGGDAQLTGFAGGLHRKVALLTQEGHAVRGDRLHRPRDMAAQASLL
jgi:methylated-DNA-[protein]-cysteine S-methyltransferase